MQYDAESAGKAGMATIGLLCGGCSPWKLREAGYVALYRDPADLLKNYGTSPLGSRVAEYGPFGGNNERDKNKEKSIYSNSTLYFLMGLGIGVAAGIVYAPKSGSATRAFLRSKSEEGIRYVNQTASDAADLAKQTGRRTEKDRCKQLRSPTKTLKVPMNLSSALEAGKKAYQEASKGTRAEATWINSLNWVGYLPGSL